MVETVGGIEKMSLYQNSLLYILINYDSFNDGGMDGEGECLPRKRRGAGVKAIALNVLLKAGDHRDKPGQTGTQ